MKLDSAVLYTNNIEKVVVFYRDVIGLELDYQAGDKFVQFKFDNNVGLGIKKAVEEREVPGHQTIFIKSENITEDYEKMKEHNIKLCKELTEEDWGSHFSIFDPDENKIVFRKRK